MTSGKVLRVVKMRMNMRILTYQQLSMYIWKIQDNKQHHHP